MKPINIKSTQATTRQRVPKRPPAADRKIAPLGPELATNNTKAVVPRHAGVVRLSKQNLPADFANLLCKSLGIRSSELPDRIVIQANALQVSGPSDLDPSERLLMAIAMMQELGPENGAEALLAVQMIGVHEAAVTFLRAATSPGHSLEGADANVIRATRLMSLFTDQLDAMSRLKKRPQQKVTVENVHVHPGGQAIVGAVSTAMSDDGGKHEE